MVTIPTASAAARHLAAIIARGGVQPGSEGGGAELPPAPFVLHNEQPLIETFVAT